MSSEALVQQLLTRFLSASTPEGLSTRRMAEALQALPLLDEMGGCYLLRTDGQVISVGWDAPEQPEVETNPRIRNTVLFAGAKRFPEILGLVPSRPESARTCPACSGTGRDPLSVKLALKNVACYCGGLGWIPGEDPWHG